MILFHGSNIEIDNIVLNLCKPYKDFGKGFYTTEIEQQACDMAKRTVKQFGGKPFITKFSINDFDLFEDKILNIEELTKRLEFKELTSQISFHTENAIKLLNKLESHSI